MKDPAQRFQSAAELATALLPLAPARARLHAERAISVLRAADPNGGDPVPSSLPEMRRAPDSTLNTAAPTVLGADTGARGPGSRGAALAVGVVALACLGLGFVGYRGLRDSHGGTATPGSTALPSAATLTAAPGMPGRADAPETKARSPSVQPAGDAAPRPPPALIQPTKAKADRSAGHVKGRPNVPAPRTLVAAAEPVPQATEPRLAAEPQQAKPRARLLDERSPVRLLE